MEKVPQCPFLTAVHRLWHSWAALPVLATLLPISDTSRLDDGKQCSDEKIFQTDNAEPQAHFSSVSNLSAGSTTGLSQFPIKAISSAFQYGFEQAQPGNEAAHNNHDS